MADQPTREAAQATLDAATDRLLALIDQNGAETEAEDWLATEVRRLRTLHAEALPKAWHEGYGAGSSDATDGWLNPGSPRTVNPYPSPTEADAPARPQPARLSR